MQKAEISVIVPFYNVEDYIFTCLKSIQNQVFENFEVIMIDDGSTDKSSLIARNFSKSDPRFKLYKKSNGGVSSSRNIGLYHAKGKYIAFIDSDDNVMPNFLSKMYESITKTDSEIAFCNFQKVDQRYNIIEKELFNINSSKEIITGSELLSYLMDKNNSQFSVLWNKLYIREIFENITFKGDLFEDEEVLVQLLWKRTKIVYVPDILYNYLQRNDSLINSKHTIEDVYYMEKILNDRVEFYYTRSKYLYQKVILFFKNWIIENFYFNMDLLNHDDIVYFQKKYRLLVRKSKYRNLKVMVKDIFGYINLRLLVNLLKFR